MWLMPAEGFIESWLQVMGRASLYGGVVITCAWLVCRVLPGMSPVVRSWIWRIVYLDLILLVCWTNPLRIPGVPELGVRLGWDGASPSVVHSVGGFPPTRAEPVPWPKQGSPLQPEWSGAHTANVALLLAWLAGLFFAVMRTLRAAVATQRSLRMSRTISDPRLLKECAVLSRRLRLRRVPRLLSLETLAGPQAAGLLHSAIMFPASLVDALSPQEARLVLAHELAHLRRHDLLWIWIRRFVNSVFFFHPMVWIAHQQATLAEETASDEMALRAVNAPISDYADTLLKVTEQSLRMAPGATALLGAGMSRAYRLMASRFQALQQIRNLSSRFPCWGRRWATLLGSIAAVILLPLGLTSLCHPSGIRQMDWRYPVLGYKVSRGQNHALSVRREVCRFAGISLSRAFEDVGQPQATGADQTSARSSFTAAVDPTPQEPSFPVRLAGWLRDFGLKPQLDTGTYRAGVQVPEESYAFIVRFAHDGGQADYADIVALLVDERGETIPLPALHSEFPRESGECVKIWVISPVPVTPAKFDLLLRLPAEDKDIALLRLGEL